MTDSTTVVLGMTSFALVVVVHVWFALALAAVFRKAGEPAWRAWVPILNVATLLKRADFSPWLVLLNVVPLFGAIAFVVVYIVAVHRVTTAFGRGTGLTVLGALIPVVWASILGWGTARWPEQGDADRVDESSEPLPRRADPAPANVPLVGGWTPDAMTGPDDPGIERSHRSPDASSPPDASNGDLGGWIPDAEAAPYAPARTRAEFEPPPASPPLVMPFAAPSVSLADVTPSAAEWSPPVEPEPVAFAAHRRDGERSLPGRTDAPQAPPIAEVPLTRASTETAAVVLSAVVAPGEEFPELSEAVSAVSEAPEAGAPRPARASISSLATPSVVPDAGDGDGDDGDEALERTVLTRRKRIPWMLVPPDGSPVALTSDVVILGRRPALDAAHPDAQLVAIVDETRTVSKTHARLRLRGDTWFVTDLDSTNGVLFATLMGTEVEAPRREEIEAGARFFLGDAEVRLARSGV